MARQQKPFPYRGWWRTKVGGKLTKLAPLTEPVIPRSRSFVNCCSSATRA